MGLAFSDWYLKFKWGQILEKLSVINKAQAVLGQKLLFSFWIS